MAGALPLPLPLPPLLPLLLLLLLLFGVGAVGPGREGGVPGLTTAKSTVADVSWASVPGARSRSEVSMLSPAFVAMRERSFPHRPRARAQREGRVGVEEKGMGREWGATRVGFSREKYSVMTF